MEKSTSVPYPENLSFEEILHSIGGGVLLDPFPKPTPAVNTMFPKTDTISELSLFPEPGNLVDVKV